MKYEELMKSLKHLSKAELEAVIAESNRLLSGSLDLSYTDSRLREMKINSTCPYCNSSIVVRNGKTPKGNLRYKCTECNRSFSHFTNTILEGSKYDYNIWLEILRSAINHLSVLDTRQILASDYDCQDIDDYTVWILRMKLIYAISTLYYSQDIKLSGVIQIDETFVREAQKGSRCLVSMISGEERHARYGYKASKYGTMGPEFSTVVTAVDETGHCVCYVTCLGKLTDRMFQDNFVKHFQNITFLCTDANNAYNSYCEYGCVPRYVKPSDYMTAIKSKGYVFGANTAEQKTKNRNILKSLYDDNLIDRIENYGKLSYSEFENLKQKHNLSLGRVNELHKDIKLYIEKEMTNVSMEYLEYYIGFFSYLRNWRVDKGHYPSSLEDAACIFEDILKNHIKVEHDTIRKVELRRAKPTTRYVNELIENTTQARDILDINRFKFREEDNVDSFNRKKILEKLPKKIINKMFRECGYKDRMYSSWTNTSKINAIVKSEKCDKLIFEYMKDNRDKVLDDEDIKELESKKYR